MKSLKQFQSEEHLAPKQLIQLAAHKHQTPLKPAAYKLLPQTAKPSNQQPGRKKATLTAPSARFRRTKPKPNAPRPEGGRGSEETPKPERERPKRAERNKTT